MTAKENNTNDRYEIAINKMLELQDILINNPPNDKSFKKHEFNYLLAYMNILAKVQYSDYNDEHIINAIDKLNDRVFKNRRY